MTNKKILITGSEGFIGSHLTERVKPMLTHSQPHLGQN